MEEDQLNNKNKQLSDSIRWSPWMGLLYVVLIYILSQVIGLVILIYPIFIKHFSSKQTSNWLTNSTYGQFLYILIAEAFTVFAVLWLLKRYKVKKDVIGLRKIKLKDPLYGFLGLVIYYPIYLVAISLITALIKGFNVNQKQDIGFNSVHGVAPLIVTFISLVILPPIAEEIVFRGFLYGSMKKWMPKIFAAIVTSVIFASAHLIEGVGGPLWVGAIDTFVLSMVLVFLREKTNGLYASMTLHGLKNFVAFFIIYLSPLMIIR